MQTIKDRLQCKRELSETGCWEWTGSCQPSGYGQITVTTAPKQRQTLYVHRLAYEQWIGPIPLGLNVCHTCDNRKCFNPAHLFVGTDQDNVNDKVSKGRLPTTEDHYAAKLTKETVAGIRSGTIKVTSQLARELDVGVRHLYSIRRGDHWPGV